MDETREIEITVAFDGDRPDLNEIGRRYTLPRREARQKVDAGEARYVDIPTDEVGRDLWSLPRDVAVRRAEELGLGVPDPAEPKTAVIARIADAELKRARAEATAELEKLTKADLRDRLPDDADVPASATKAELVEAVTDAEAPATPEPAPAPVEPTPNGRKGKTPPTDAPQ